MLYDNLQPEIITESPTLLEFLEAMSEVVENSILSPAKELEQIRNITENTDPVIIANTIKDLGFNLPADIVAHNAKKLAKAIYMLPLYHEVAGTERFTEALSFILGRDVAVRNLYTKNYVDFYEKPYGPLIIDGGDWYKTTHINLMMEMVPSDSKLILEENETVKDRLLEAFYEFAPINLVVKQFSLGLKMVLQIDIAGTVILRNKNRKYITSSFSPNLIIEGPSKVMEKTVQNYRAGYLLRTYAVNERAPIFFLAGEGITGENIENETLLVLRQTQVVNTPVMEDNQYAYVAYPKVFGYSYFTDIETQYTGGWEGSNLQTFERNGEDWYLFRTDTSLKQPKKFELFFQNAQIEKEIDNEHYVNVNAKWLTSNSEVAYAIDGNVYFNSISRNKYITLIAEFQGTRAEYPVTVIAYRDKVNRIIIEGPDTVYSNTRTPFSVFSISEKGEREELNERIMLLSDNAIMQYSKGVNTLVAAYSNEDDDLYLSAVHISEDGVKFEAVKNVRLSHKPEGVYLVALTTTVMKPQGKSLSAALTGISEVIYEGDDVLLNAKALFSDGSQYEVYPEWVMSSPALLIVEDGLATAQTIEGSLDVDVKATYQNKGIVVQSVKTVRIEKAKAIMEKLEVVGPDSVMEYKKAKFNAMVTWNEGYTAAAEAVWSSSAFSIDEDGIFQAGSVDSPKMITIVARIDNFIAKKEVIVEDEAVTLTGIEISGPDNVRQGTHAKYTTFARYSNGSILEVYAEYHIDYENAEINNGLLTFTTDKVQTIDIRATLKQSNTEVYTHVKSVSLMPNVYILSSLLISGSDTLAPDETIQLQALAVYANGFMENVSPTWSVKNQNPDDKSIYSDWLGRGLLQGRHVPDGKDRQLTVSAKFFGEMAYHTVTLRTPKKSSNTVPVSSRIIGDPVIMSDEIGSYAQLVKFDNGCDEIAVSSEWAIGDITIWDTVEKACQKIDCRDENGRLIAEIDEHGYLRPLYDEDNTITITALYSCDGHTLVNTYVVHIRATQVTDRLLIEGNSFTVLPNSIQTFIANIFHENSEFKRSQGIHVTENLTWKIEPDTVDARVTESGELQVNNVEDGTSFNLIVEHNENGKIISDTRTIVVLKQPAFYCTGQIGMDIENPSERLEFKDTIKINQTGYYGYFYHQSTLGISVFINKNDNTKGGWKEPVAVFQTVNGYKSIWYVYRTEYSITKPVEYEVYFER